MRIFDIVKSKDKFERAEGFCIIGLVFGTVLLSLGIGLSILDPKGISAISAMVGSLISFLATVALIVVWLVKELTSE